MNSLHPDMSVVADSAAGLVLVVDDNSVNRKVLHALLRNEGYAVVMAADGAEAIAVFETSPVDFVFMDVMMPGVDGYQATRRIKQLCQEHGRFCPVLFVTALTDESSLAECLACGGDDFMVKPYNHTILRAKIRALERIRDLYELIKNQKDEIEEHHESLRHQHEVAERTFSKLMRTGFLEAANLNHLLEPVDLTSGDLLLAEFRPDGVQHVLLGDFTGHGLAAAIGAIPVADIFQSMTRKGFGIDQIATEINRKLKASLPVGLFLAACLLSLDTREGRLCIWNGGVPDVLLQRAGVGVCARLSSRHLPLGILAEDEFNDWLDCADIHVGDHVYAYSDGLIEAVNPGDEMFGAARLDALLMSVDGSGSFKALCADLSEFRQGCPQRDDITLVEIECIEPVAVVDRTPTVLQGAGALSLRVEFSADRLRQGNAHPDLTRLLEMFPGLGAYRSTLYTVLAELFNNALEHGLLRLDSVLKDAAGGFNEYYRQRERQLWQLEQGSICIELQLSGDSNAGWMRIAVTDSGPGFDYAASPMTLPMQGLSRRGLALVRSLCQQLEFHGTGNRVEAVYVWSESEVEADVAG
jgi:CheY-like chemotaxis protein